MTDSADRYPGRPRTAIGVAVGAFLPAVAGAALQAASRVPVTPDVLFLVVDVMVALVYGSVAAVILARRSHPVAWLVALAAIGGGVAAFGGGWASFAVTHPAAPDASLGMSLFGSAWVPGTLSLFLVVPWLVRDHRLSPAAWVGLGAGAATALTFTLQRFFFPMADNTGLILAVVVVGLGSAIAVAWRHRYGPPAERAGLGLLAVGTAAMALSFLPLVLIAYTDDAVLLLVPISHLACQAVFPGALLVTMLRNRLWGIDLAVSRAVIAGLLTLGMVAVYAALVWLATVLVGSSAAAQAVAAVGVVLAVNPLRRWIEARVRRLVWGEAASPGHAALSIGASLSAAREDEELLDRLAASVGEALHLESVTLTLRGLDESSGRWGVPTSAAIERPISRSPEEQEPIGGLAITARPGVRLDRRTFDALDRLQPVLAVGLGLVRASRDVARARDAATHARLAERRVIRRELHDGIGPWLSGLRLGLQGARNTLRSDPVAADAVLEALQKEVAQRVQDVRLLSRSLLPPVLEEQGLGAALTELVARHSAAGFTVDLIFGGALAQHPETLRELDAPVAAAAYAVISESVLNAARHSGAPGCEVELALSDAPEALVVACRDRGAGRSPAATDGVGTRSMRERTEELGGTLAIGRGRDGRGTSVRAELPLAPLGVPS
ncbi:MAG TPA: histidine kinase [Arachnia sp.]|nr:histidine kinase [Arachnia sp.]HMT87557.1 histidine kinase [Arachnia sp.]